MGDGGALNFEFATAGRILFGAGQAVRLGEHLRGWGRRAVLVTGANPERGRCAEEALKTLGVEYAVLRVSGEPTVDEAVAGAGRAREFGAEFVVACGGGSALDLGKAVAALVTNLGPVLDYLEVIGAGRPLQEQALPVAAVPTTAGTGSEVTKNAVLASPEHGVKVSLRHESMLPRLALVDPELTVSLPPRVTASTGLDALTQCIEPYLSCRANPLTDAVALAGIERGARSLRRAVHNGEDVSAREDLSLCSLFGGLALANAKLGAVHGIAGPFGGLFDSPHGAVCARLLPFALEVNLRALLERAPEHPACARFEVLARLVTGRPTAQATDAARWCAELCAELSVPPLAQYGMTRRDVSALAEKAARASSMQGNAVVLRPEEIVEILERAL